MCTKCPKLCRRWNCFSSLYVWPDFKETIAKESQRNSWKWFTFKEAIFNEFKWNKNTNFFFPNPIFSSFPQLYSRESNIAWNLKTFITHFTHDVTQKPGVLKMADGRAYLTLFHRQKDNKLVSTSIRFLRSK